MRITLALLSILFCFSACNNGDDPILTFNVTVEFNLSMKENLTETSKDFVIQVESIEGFNCDNATVDLVFSRSENELFLSIDNILKPNGCEEGVIPAKGEIIVGSLENGNYPLNINLRDVVVNNGLLSVTETEYSYTQVEDVELEGIVIEHNILNRISEEKIWGRIEYNDDSANQLPNKFINNLMDNGMLQTYFKIGNYSDFNIDSNSMMNWHQISEFTNSVSFVLDRNLLSDSEIKIMVDNFNDQYQSNFDFDIDLFTATGKEF